MLYDQRLWNMIGNIELIEIKHFLTTTGWVEIAVDVPEFPIIIFRKDDLDILLPKNKSLLDFQVRLAVAISDLSHVMGIEPSGLIEMIHASHASSRPIADNKSKESDEATQDVQLQGQPPNHASKPQVPTKNIPRNTLPSADAGGGVQLYVGGLPYSVDEPELAKIFSSAGRVVGVTVVTDRFTGQSKGFGFVAMADEREAETAIATLNKSIYHGRSLTVTYRHREREGAGARLRR